MKEEGRGSERGWSAHTNLVLIENKVISYTLVHENVLTKSCCN